MSYWNRTIDNVGFATRSTDAMFNDRPLPTVFLVTHGETAWSSSGQHTGLTDLSLTDRGEQNARRLSRRLKGIQFAKVFTSPLQRALWTCEIAGFGGVADIAPDLVEWDYGKYEGLTSDQIRCVRPEWQLFRDGCPGGESPQQVSRRAERVIERVRRIRGDVLLFSGGNFLRVVAARWLGLDPAAGRFFQLATASLSALTYEHDICSPVIQFWDDTRHVIA